MAKDKITAEADINEKLSWLSSKYKTNLEIEYLDTGSIILNKLFGGGLPMTKNIQIYSESGYGKSTITISMCKALCKQGHRVLYIDAEGSVNENLLRTMGILTSDENNLLYDAETNPDGPFLFVQISYFEDIEEILETLIPKYNNKGVAIESDFRLVVIDSVAALAPKEYRGDSGEKLSVTSNKPGIVAKALAAFLRKFNGYKTAYNMSFLYINQTRENLSMNFASKYEDSIPGGKAMIYYTDVLIKLTSRGLYKKKVTTGAGEEQEIPTEREIGVTCKKNKITDGQVTLPLQVVFGRGISNIAAMPYVLRRKTITDNDGNRVYMVEGQGVSLTLNIITKDEETGEDTFKSIKCKGMPGLKENIRKYYGDILRLITEDDYKALEEDEDYGEL